MNPYPCHNHPKRVSFVTEHMVPDGFHNGGCKAWKSHQTEWAVVQCCHDKPEADPRCEGCFWRQNKNAE